MGYLKEIKNHRERYGVYLTVKQWVRNAFERVKVDYGHPKRLAFHVKSHGLSYVLEARKDNMYFYIVDKNEKTSEIEARKSNRKAIEHRIKQTLPETITHSSVRMNMKLHNRFTGKRFCEEDLLNLAEWTQKEKKHSVKVDETYTYYGDSQAEIDIVRHLLRHKCAKVLRGQDYAIHFDEKRYFPDIVYLNHLNQIVVLEVKSKVNFSEEKTIRKFVALADKCRELGYVFGMIDRNFMSYQSYLKLPVLKGFEKDVLRILKTEGEFDSKRLTKLRAEKYSHVKRRALEKMVTKIVLDHRLVNRPKTVHDLRILNERLRTKHYGEIMRNQ